MSGSITTPVPSPVKLNSTAPEGPKALPVVLPFSMSITSITLNLLQLLTTGQMSSVQSAFIDNSANAQQLSITCALTGQRNVVPPQSQAWVTILAPNQAQLVFSTTGAVTVTAQLCNFASTPAVISSNSSSPPFTFSSANGYLQVTDVALDALLQSTGLPVIEQIHGNGDNIRPKFGGTKAFCLAISSGTSSGNIITASPSFFFTDLRITVDGSATVATAGDVIFTLKDGSTTIFEGSLTFAITAQPTYNRVLCDFDGMNYISSGTGQNLTLTWSQSLSAGNVYINCFGGTTASIQ